MVTELVGILEGALVLHVGGPGVGDFGRAVQTPFARIVLGLIVRVAGVLHSPAHEIVPFEALDRQDVESGAGIGGNEIHVVIVAALIEHCHRIVVVHRGDGVVASVRGVVLVIDRLGRIMEEGLAEDAGAGAVVLPLGIT